MNICMYVCVSACIWMYAYYVRINESCFYVYLFIYIQIYNSDYCFN